MNREKSREEFFAVVSAIAKFIEHTDAKLGGNLPPAQEKEERESYENRK